MLKQVTEIIRPRRLALLGATLGLLLVAAVPTIAQAAPRTAAVTTAHSVAATATPCPLSCVKAFGDKLIADRITSLNTASSKIGALVTKGALTTSQANAFLQPGNIHTSIPANISGLQALQTKLDSETSEADAREDVKNIFLTFRIYAVFLPVIRNIVVIDVMTNVDAKMHSIQSKIEDAIAKDDDHKDQLNSLYADYKSQLQLAEGQMDAAQGQLPVLTPSTYNEHNGDYATAWKTFRGDIESAHDHLKKAKDDLHQIVMILKADNGKSPTATTGAATPTGTPGQ
jgi:hypothetical protein